MNEMWKPVFGYEGWYEVSNLGRVRTDLRLNKGHHKPGHILKLCEATNHYLHVGLWKERKKKQRTVHTLVLESFEGPCPSGKECRHFDGNRQNNRIDNLSWATRAENFSDKKRHGTSNTGSRHGMSKLTEAEVIQIRGLTSQGIPNLHIATLFGLTPSNVGYIVKRKTWNHI